MTVRQALKKIRADFAGRDYIPGHRVYDCDRGTLFVRNAPAADRESKLLGVFVAQMVNASGESVRVYKV